MTFTIHGLGVSRGIAIGSAHILRKTQADIPEYHITEAEIADESSRLQDAIMLVGKQLRALHDSFPTDTSIGIAEFIDTYLLVLNDTLLIKEPERIIREKLCNAEWAVKLFHDHVIDTFDSIEDSYLSARRNDISYVLNRIIHALLDLPMSVDHDATTHPHNHIVIAENLSVEDILLFERRGTIAFATKYGAPSAHTSIIARSMGIPGVVGLQRAWHYINNEELIILDGDAGILIIAADERIIAEYQQRRQQQQHYLQTLQSLQQQPTRTRDGHSITLMANVELPEDFAKVTQMHTSGVGLYRTEFLFMNRDTLPDEEEQYQHFVTALQQMPGLPLTIRTLDAGADQLPAMLSNYTITQTNMALGLRSIRLCLREPRLFIPHLRAILRASAHGKIRLLLPLLTSLHEIQHVLTLIRKLQTELQQAGQKYDAQMPVGAMIETPAAALCAEQFATELDFLSIGTNDLIQFCMAADRENNEVNYLHDPLHPAILQLLDRIVAAGKNNATAVILCGEIAGDTKYIRLLLSLGLREFSVNPGNLLEIRKAINHSDIQVLDDYREKILAAVHTDELHALLTTINSYCT